MPLYGVSSPFLLPESCKSMNFFKLINMGKYTYKKQFGIVVICQSEDEQKKLFDELKKQGLTLKVVVV